MKRNWDDPHYRERDRKWQAQMRARQSWYRQIVLGQEAGIYLGKKRGNWLRVAEENEGYNFLIPEIAAYVETWLASGKQPRALAVPDRLKRNMLSSQPLCFNLFVPLADDLDLASEVLGKMTNGRVARVSQILFEYSPERDNIRYTNDGTAYDVFVCYRDFVGGAGFLGIEAKYFEKLRGDSDIAEDRERYSEIAEQMGCFKPSCREQLRRKPLGQIWRNHLLAGSHQIADGFDDAVSVLLYPAENEACVKAAAAYQECLTDSSSFDVWTIDELVALIREIRPSGWIESFYTRYLSSDYLADKQANSG